MCGVSTEGVDCVWIVRETESNSTPAHRLAPHSYGPSLSPTLNPDDAHHLTLSGQVLHTANEKTSSSNHFNFFRLQVKHFRNVGIE